MSCFSCDMSMANHNGALGIGEQHGAGDDIAGFLGFR